MLFRSQRGALGDNDYRRFIQARIMANVSNGTTDEMIDIFAKVTSPSIVAFQILPPATFELFATRGTPMSDAVRSKVNRIMQDAKPSGVAMGLYESITGYFGFDTDPQAHAFDVGIWTRVI